MKKSILSLCFALAMLLGMVTSVSAASHPFEDVIDTQWYGQYVEYVYVHKLMNGTSDTIFQPQSTMTRAMVVTVIHRLAGTPESEAQTPFTDVPLGTWYSDAVLWAVENQITNGTSATTFSPETSISREQLVTFLYRYAQKLNLELTQSDLTRYSDHGQISSFANVPFAWAVANGIITGTDETHLAPLKTTSRAECATILTRFDLWYRGQNEPIDPPHVHTYVEAETVLPTCTEGGYTTYACACGDSYQDDVTAPNGHDYDVVVTEPTCTEGGYTTYTCACGDSYQSDVTAPNGHDYEAVVTEPTCTEGGYTTYTCFCGDSYVADEIAALGHTWDGGKVTTEPTEDKVGIRTYTCTVCGTNRIEYIDPLDHTHHFEQEITAPTCTEGGYTTYTCGCGFIYQDDETAAAGHQYEAVETIVPTCTEGGYTVYECFCGDVTKDDETQPTGHTYEKVQTVEPTCTEGGYSVFRCFCGDSYVGEETQAAGHKYEKGATIVPTCTEGGYTIYRCFCGEFYTDDEIEPAGHQYAKIETVEPTCTQAGYSVYQCVCGEGYTADRVAALGHQYTEEVIAPTFEAEGYTQYTCGRCGHQYRDHYTDKLPPAPDPISFEEYREMTAEEQRAYMEAFADLDAFFDWFFEAREKYKEEHPDIEIGGGDINIGDIIGGGK